MLWHNLWEELKRLVSKPLLWLWTLQGLVAGKLISRTGVWIYWVSVVYNKACIKCSSHFDGSWCRFTLPPYLTLKNFEGLDLGKMDQVRVKCHSMLNSISINNSSITLSFSVGVWFFLQADDSGLASYVAGQIDRTLSWQVTKKCHSKFRKTMLLLLPLLFGSKQGSIIVKTSFPGCQVAADHHQVANSCEGCAYCWGQ